MHNLIYWSPCLGNVGTIKSTINSAVSFKKYSKNEFSVKIINACGEWNNNKEFFKKNNVEVVDLAFNYFKYLPQGGYLKSRISYIIIFLISFIPLTIYLKKQKNSFFIAHLITSLPLFLSFFFKKNIKFVLRISGYPRLNFLRFFFWKIIFKKIYLVTCPTTELQKKIINLNFVEINKIKYLPDAIIDISDFLKKKSEKIDLPNNKKFILNVGRLTKQKNQLYLIKEIKEFLNQNKDYDLIIIGEGELKNNLNNEIINLGLEKRIHLLGHLNNPYPYMKLSSAFILSSLWEEVGFVIVESALSNCTIISSNCASGPTEFLLNGEAGYLFENNKIGELSKLIKNINVDNYKKKVLAKKSCLKYTKFRHYIKFKSILNEN